MSDFTSFDLLYCLDLIGVVACSVAGSLLAKRKGMDFSGAVIVAMVGAIGGGTLRDLLLSHHPPFWLTDLNYLVLITATALVVQVLYNQMNKLYWSIRWFDAIGLAAFSVIGFEAAQAHNMALPIVVLMGIITAVVGGIGRDMICDEIPYILRKEIYIFAALAGGVFYVVVPSIGLPQWLNQTLCMALIIIVRMVSVYRDWHLPDITWRR